MKNELMKLKMQEAFNAGWQLCSSGEFGNALDYDSFEKWYEKIYKKENK